MRAYNPSKDILIKYAMIRINSDTALALQKYSDQEVYILHDDGAESLIEDSEEILLAPDASYGIEGEVFGEPYEYKGPSK